uniref:RRM domain-containing protein n=1 Tax=Rhizophagus irregularis (strain DAOM 181602 / DAOM 197198 / MUCL 43194) TaxID=747089 RepID=U9STP9_RHIID
MEHFRLGKDIRKLIIQKTLLGRHSISQIYKECHVSKTFVKDRTHTLPENPMEEDFIADSVADAGGSGITPSQQNNTDILNYHLLLPKTLLRLLRQIKTHLVLTRLCTLQRIKKLPLDASPDKDIMETNDTSPSFDTPTITIIRHDFQTAALLNASSEFIKKYPTNRAMIDAVNNLFLETFHSYTGRAHVSGSGDQKRLVTDIPFFIKKDDITALFKNMKKSHREFVTVFSQLPSNTKDIHLAPLVREIGAMAVNVPLSLNSYKLKKWAYITFKSQQMMDAAMEQSIALQKHVLTWELLQNTNKLCHRCAKLGYAPTACPLNNSRGCSRTHNLVAHLKEHFNIGQPLKNSSNNHNWQHYHSQSNLGITI